jgi:hypothetical protein
MISDKLLGLSRRIENKYENRANLSVFARFVGREFSISLAKILVDGYTSAEPFLYHGPA